MVSENSSILLKTVNTQWYLKLFQKHKNIRNISNYCCKESITLIAKPKNNFIKNKLQHMSFINITEKIPNNGSQQIFLNPSKFVKIVYHDDSGFKIYGTNSLHSSLQRGKPTSPPLKCCLYLVTHFQWAGCDRSDRQSGFLLAFCRNTHYGEC